MEDKIWIKSCFICFQMTVLWILHSTSYGYEKCRPLHSYGPFVRNHFLFHYIISGKGTLLVDDENSHSTEYQLQGGMGFLIEPDRVNTYFADREDPWEYAWIEFSGLRAKEILEGSGLSSASPVYLPRTPQDGERLKNEILYLATHSQESSYHLIGHLFLIMDALVSGSSSRRRTQAANAHSIMQMKRWLLSLRIIPVRSLLRIWHAAAIWTAVTSAKFSVTPSVSPRRNF